jgi:hypothetical protein
LIEFLKGCLAIYIIFILIAVVWQIGEKEMYGEITHRRIDDIVALILAISIYLNIK